MTRMLAVALLCCGLATPARAEYVVAIFAPFKGPQAAIGESLRNGIVLALEEAEDAGRFGEVRLSLKEIDDTGTPARAAARVEAVVREHYAILVIGPAFSPQAEAAAALANRHGFTLLAPGVSEGITQAGSWSFRVGMNPYLLLRALGERALAEWRPATVATVHMAANAGYAAQAAALGAAARASGAKVAAPVVAQVDNDFIPGVVDALRAAKPEAIFICMDAEPAAALAAALRMGDETSRIRFAFAPAAAQPALLRIGGAAIEGAFTAADYLPEAASEQNGPFLAAYQRRFGLDADRWAGIGYATGQLAAEAIRNAGPNPTPSTVREALERIRSVRVLLGDGPWTQDAERNPRYPAAIFRVEQGRFVPVPALRTD